MTTPLLRYAILPGLLALAAACKPSWPRDPREDTKSETTIACEVGPAGRFIVSADSVGQFPVVGTTMDDVVSSCGAVSTEWEATCCDMSVKARFDYPGVHVAAEQESRDSLARPLSPVAAWEVAGDSIYLAGVGLMPTTIAGLSRALGRGWAENPDHDDNDGPMAHFCAMPNLSFRIRVPASMAAPKWLVDTSAVNRDARIISMVVRPKHPGSGAYCTAVTDSLAGSIPPPL